MPLFGARNAMSSTNSPRKPDGAPVAAGAVTYPTCRVNPDGSETWTERTPDGVRSGTVSAENVAMIDRIMEEHAEPMRRLAKR